VQDVTVRAERWTQERRRQHTRDLLLDAAEEVFAKRGFAGASLDEIAETAGYTRGAIYKHFESKADLFLAANTRFNDRYVHAFVDLVDPGTSLEDLDLKAFADRWRELNNVDERRLVLGAEFSLYMLRHPEIRDRVRAQRRETAEMVASFIEEQAARTGMKLRMPAITLARVVLAASDGIQLASRLDGPDDDLYEPFLELIVSAWE
jgi:AcrR family transcriptional regulator